MKPNPCLSSLNFTHFIFIIHLHQRPKHQKVLFLQLQKQCSSLSIITNIKYKFDHRMQNQQLQARGGVPQSKILKVQAKGNQLKVLGTTKSRLVIQENSSLPNNQQHFQELESSNEKISRPRTKKTTNTSQDFVDLPKVNFTASASDVRQRKNSQVIIDTRLVQEQQSKGDLKSMREEEISEQQEQKLQQNAEWAGWNNINDLNIVPSRNNYLKEENYEYLTIPSYRNVNAAHLAVSKDKDPDRSRSRSRERRRSEEERNQERRLVKERERRQRERNIEIVTGFLSGKASVTWLFILSQEVKEEDLKQIKQLYRNHMENDYQVPICRSYSQALKFLKIQSCYFKIVADLDNSQKLIEDSPHHKNIIAIYIYNPKAELGINRSFEMKRATKKIKGMFMDLADAAKQASLQIQNQPRFIQVDNQLQKQKTKLKFPSFALLTGYDTTEITSYRLCLYGSLKLKGKKERMEYLKEFTDMVELRYAQVPKELKNLQEYKQIDHFEQSNDKKARQILNFYVRQTFYYVLINSILRMSRSPEEFRPCTMPFNETYHSIKHFYTRFREESGRRIKKFVTYRGSKLRNNDAKSLEIGSYIQLLGFTSTSLKRSQAQKFMDNDSYLIQIMVQICAQNEQQQLYDHGFVEINRYGLANQAFKNEQEVLFNALNVFKVIELDLSSAVRKITLRYGAIFDLLRANPQSLSPHQRAVIANYQYCTKTYNQIEDDGDVLLLAQEHDRCVDYYQAKIDEGQINYKIFGKIANAQFQNGDLDEAYNNALRSIQQLNKQPQKNVKEVYNNYSKYEKNKVIFEAKEDFVHFKATIQKYVKILGEDWLSQAKLFKQRGEKCLKAGDLDGCSKDLEKSKAILKQKEQSFQKRRKQINRRYMLRSFCCMCSRTATAQLEEQRQLELLKIEQDQVDFQNRMDQTHQLLFQIQNTSKELAEKMGNKQMENQSKQAAAAHFNQMSKKNQTQSPIILAKFLAMQASIIQEKESSNSQEFEQLMQEAIETVKKQDPFHEHLGLYQNILGTKRHATIKKRMMLQPIHREQPSRSEDEPIIAINSVKLVDQQPSRSILPQTAKYNYQIHKQLYQKSKESFCEAAENIAYNKGSEHPDYLAVRNNITELDYDFSRLKDSQKTAEQSTEIRLSSNHSEGAKCYLLIAKICLAKGQLKKSFRNIERAYEILKSALVKMDRQEYSNIFMNHPYYMDISIQKVKIFNRQLKHDLALKELQISKKIAKLKVENLHSKTVLATIYEEQAAVLICMGETVSFEEYLTKAISIREEEIGKFNIPNAISYSNLYKYLRVLNDAEDALTYHHKAVEIFARFPSDHPSAWIIHLSNGLYFFQRKQIGKFMSEMEYCMKVASKRYSANHISTLKIMFQFGKMLISVEEHDKALDLLLRLEVDLEQSLKESLRGEKLERQMDDQKIPLRKNLYSELKQLYSRSKINSSENNSMDQLKRCQQKLKDFQHLALSTQKLMKSSASIK